MKNSTFSKKMWTVLLLWFVGYSVSSAATADTTAILSETFATSLGDFTAQSVVGDQVWAWSSYSSVGFAKISGYSSGNIANEDWLISPAIDLTNATAITLSFNNAHKYGMNAESNLQLMVSDSYTSGTIDSTTWTAFSFTHGSGSDYTFVSSGNVSLEAYAGKSNVHIAFRYKSDATAAATWEVNNFLLRGIVSVAPVETTILSENFDKFSAGSLASPSSTNVAASLDTYTQTTGWSGTYIYAAGGAAKLGGSSTQGTLTTPSIDLSASSGDFYVSFYASKWSTDSTYVNILVNGTQAKVVTGLSNTGLAWFGPYKLTGGTSATTIQFAAAAANKARVFLDSLVISQYIVPATTPTVSLTSAVFKAEAGGSQTKELTLTGAYLTSDLTLTLTNTVGSAFSTTITSVTADQATADGGFAVPVVYAPTAAGNDTATITFTGGGLTSPVVVTIAGSAYAVVNMATLADLRAANVANPTDVTTIYKVTGECVVTWVQSSGNTKFIQDATGGLMIYDTQGKITTTFAAGDGMTGLSGTLTLYGAALELIPVNDVAVSSSNNVVVPVTLTIPEAKTDKERYESTLVLINSLSNATTSTAWGTTKKSFNFVNGTDTIVLRTNYTGLDYMTAETLIPTTATDYAGILSEYNGTVQLFPRSSSDIGYVNSVRTIDVTTEVYGSNGTLHVNAVQGQTIEVYNIMGRKVLSAVASEGENVFQLGKNQLLLVKVGGIISKVVL
jgi:hypothetical protein